MINVIKEVLWLKVTLLMVAGNAIGMLVKVVMKIQSRNKTRNRKIELCKITFNNVVISICFMKLVRLKQ